MVNPEALDRDPFIQQVMNDVEQISREQTAMDAPNRYSIRLHMNEGGITGIWDAALDRFYEEGNQVLRFAEQDNAIEYLANIQRKSGYSKKFLEEHEDDIIIHKAAKKAFDELGLKKLPTVKSLQVEFAEKLAEKKEAYAELKKVRDELRELTVHKANYEELRDLEEREKRKEKEHGRE